MTITVEIESIEKALIEEELAGLLPPKPDEFPEPLSLTGYSLADILGKLDFHAPQKKRRRLLPSNYLRLVAAIKYLSGDPAGNEKRRKRHYGVLLSNKYWHWDPNQRRHWDSSKREAVQKQLSHGQKVWLGFVKLKGPEWRELKASINWDKACLPTLDHGRAPRIWPPKKSHKDPDTRFGLVNLVKPDKPLPLENLPWGADSDDMKKDPRPDDPAELNFHDGVSVPESIGRAEADDSGSDRTEQDDADPERKLGYETPGFRVD